MKTAKVLFRVASILVLLASVLPVSGAQASTGKPVNVTACVTDVRPDPSDSSVVWVTESFFPDIGPNGKEGFEGIQTGPITIRIRGATGQAGLRMLRQFDGLVWEAGNPVPWSGHLHFLVVGSGTPGNSSGTTRTLNSSVHFVGTWANTPEAAARCAAMGYFMGGDRITGEVHISPAR